VIRRLALVLLAACGVLSASGCALQRAAQVELQVLDGQIVMIKPSGGLQRGGETVIKIDNFAPRPVSIVLAKTDAPANHVPKKLVDAVSPRDDDRIVAMTSRVDKVGVAYQYGAIPQPSPRVVKLHVYLKPGQRYLLFDQLGGYAHGMVIALVPPRGT
jgi:hypothetical protein